ncbi:unnamed protein product [Cuscuta campestris]|uniref:Uncharacterized protein n=1 Tax=Cuscuta campestris TaxID=132261 RepID=A0A484N504_9ASTE|nr:unnamed protein product [Cuscuta campestris]
MAAGLLPQSAAGSKGASNVDMISQLPHDLKDRILECLDSREAARTALLSTQWKDVWLRHGRLVFDWDFHKTQAGRKRTREDNKREDFVKMVTEILLSRSGPVKKFKLVIPKSGPKLLQSDLEVWCRHLSRNGIEELHLACSTVDQEGGKLRYKLPICIFSCHTIKQMRLDGFSIVFPANARLGSIFSCLTSLHMRDCVVCMHHPTGTVPTIPNLEELVFCPCGDIKDFVVSAPKLRTLCVMYSPIQTDWEWFEPHFRTIKLLMLSPETLLLLKRFPNLLVLRIVLGDKPCSTTHAREAAPRMLEDPSGWFDDQDLCKLAIVLVETFSASRQEMLFMKAILSSSPALDKFVIKESSNIDASVAFKFPRELLSFRRASPKAQIIFDGR